MGLSKPTRIKILLAIDVVFFFVEITVGYAVHSLALVADSFHMLNDVISLCVGLWAVKIANEKTNSKMYTYGWQRAETLGALVNGVFLVALCLSIFLEAIQRFVEPQEVHNPKLILIVGSVGLLSNFIGLFLFHDHGHGHGGHSHGHTDIHAAEEGHSHGLDHEDRVVADPSGNVAEVLPQTRVGNFPSAVSDGPQTPAKSRNAEVSWTPDAERTPRRSSSKRVPKRHHRSQSRGYSTLEEVYVHPSSFRNSIIEAGRMDEQGDSGSDADNENALEDVDEPSEEDPLLSNGKVPDTAPKTKRDDHTDHKHNKPTEATKGGHGHSHDLNMRGVFLHVLGDALGNVGVMVSALIIWLTPFWWRFYSDPAISLIITMIILGSAIPLCKAASRILLQAVPAGLSIDDIKDDVTQLDGIISCHHVHVWQLSDTKLIASLHVQVDFEFKGDGSARYMALAREIRECLHEYGIHSSTIQPEFCLDATHDHSAANTDESGAEDTGSPRNSAPNSKNGSVQGNAEACLLECGDACGSSKQCCDTAVKGCAGGR
ncbi:cation efflux protein [Byssothecium circinans]|uniref:Cation efflux protein n=1 Tax=Byssothecium circinans TaxID=147558 RepID=A0A6A5U5D6_9PLEO|nr:cation efflux protein [Byssothecium circinans]